MREPELQRTPFSTSMSRIGMLEQSVVPAEVIKDEPLLYSASPTFASTYGGPLTRAALAQMKTLLIAHRVPDGYHWVIDTRSHMLMPGQYPAIPGWHCDGVPRDFEGQPDLPKLRSDVLHAVCHVSTHPAGVSNTEFAVFDGEIDVDVDAVWSSCHKHLSEMKVDTMTPGDGRIYTFTMPTFHRATPALHRGWRWWMRASMYYKRPINEIRHHVQVYTVGEGAGW